MKKIKLIESIVHPFAPLLGLHPEDEKDLMRIYKKVITRTAKDKSAHLVFEPSKLLWEHVDEGELEAEVDKSNKHEIELERELYKHIVKKFGENSERVTILGMMNVGDSADREVWKITDRLPKDKSKVKYKARGTYADGCVAAESAELADKILLSKSQVRIVLNESVAAGKEGPLWGKAVTKHDMEYWRRDGRQRYLKELKKKGVRPAPMRRPPVKKKRM